MKTKEEQYASHRRLMKEMSLDGPFEKAMKQAHRRRELWRFGPEIKYEVGDTFVWAADSRNIYCGTKAAKPFGTYKITEIVTSASAEKFGWYWYEAELVPENPMTKKDMLEIST